MSIQFFLNLVCVSYLSKRYCVPVFTEEALCVLQSATARERGAGPLPPGADYRATSLGVPNYGQWPGAAERLTVERHGHGGPALQRIA